MRGNPILHCICCAVIAAVGSTSGCGPRIDSSEFGQVVHGLPKIPAGEKPFSMPELNEPKSAANAANQDSPPATAAESAVPADASETATADASPSGPAGPAAKDTGSQP